MGVEDYILEIKRGKLIRNSRVLKGDILDVGAGTAPYGDIFLETCDTYTPVDLVDFDANKRWPTLSESYDTVFLGDVLEHCPDPLSVLKEAHRTLCHDGYLLIFTPWQWRRHSGRADDLPEIPTDYWRFAPKGIASLVIDAGFSKVQSDPLTKTAESLALKGFAALPDYVFRLLFPLMIITKWVDSLSPNYNDTISYFSIANKI